MKLLLLTLVLAPLAYGEIDLVVPRGTPQAKLDPISAATVRTEKLAALKSRADALNWRGVLLAREDERWQKEAEARRKARKLDAIKDPRILLRAEPDVNPAGVNPLSELKAEMAKFQLELREEMRIKRELDAAKKQENLAWQVAMRNRELSARTATPAAAPASPANPGSVPKAVPSSVPGLPAGLEPRKKPALPPGVSKAQRP